MVRLVNEPEKYDSDSWLNMEKKKKKRKKRNRTNNKIYQKRRKGLLDKGF
jgi:hypothetical protein